MNKIGMIKLDNTNLEAVKMKWDHKELFCLVFNLLFKAIPKKVF